MASLEEARAVKDKLKKILTEDDSIGLGFAAGPGFTTSSYVVKVYLHNISMAAVFPAVIDGVEICYVQQTRVTKLVAGM